jgi:hypothetical protein
VRILGLVRFVAAGFLTTASLAADKSSQRYPHALFLFRGDYTRTSLIDNVRFDVNKVKGESMWGIGYAYRFKNNSLSGLVPVRVNYITGLDIYWIHDFHTSIYQANPFLAININSTPIFSFFCLGIMVGEGVSFSTNIPTYERQEGGNSKTLNYFFYDLLLFLPNYPRLQFLYHTTHRCNCHGFLFKPHNTVVGSTAIGWGIRYWF